MNYFRNTSPTMAYGMPTVSDYSQLMTEGVVQPIIDGMRQAATNLFDSYRALGGAYGVYQPQTGTRQSAYGTCHAPKQDCCASYDPCHCKCCIVDADLVAYARLGERRLLPIVIENRWRRERPVKLELSDFTSRGGKASPVRAKLMADAGEYTLPPCGQLSVVLLFESSLDDAELEQAKLGQVDVDDCLVSYADLRVIGCDIRPLRIAVALLPRDCSPYVVECSCECC